MPESPSMRPPGGAVLAALVAAVVLSANGVSLVVMAWLREDPMFWRNAGGYPVWLRETVHAAFVPLFLVQAAALVFGTLRALLHRSWSMIQLVLAPVFLGCWILLGAAAMQAVANNVANWFGGRPIHSHPVNRAW